MICKHCKTAGETTKTLEKKGPLAEATIAGLLHMHTAKCPGGSRCDCQHKVGYQRKESSV